MPQSFIDKLTCIGLTQIPFDIRLSVAKNIREKWEDLTEKERMILSQRVTEFLQYDTTLIVQHILKNILTDFDLFQSPNDLEVIDSLNNKSGMALLMLLNKIKQSKHYTKLSIKSFA